MRVLITGASGFIGDHIVRRAVGSGASVRVLLSKQDREFEQQHPSVEVCAASLSDETAIEQAVRNVDVIIHTASKNIDTDGTGFEETNVRGSERLCAAAKRSGVSKLIYLSSVGVYGHGRHRDATESTPLGPDTPFSRSKAEAESIVLRHHVAHDFRAVILRHRFVYGDNDRFLIPRMIRAIKRGTFLVSGGRARLSFVSTADLAEVAVQLIERDAEPVSPVYHVTDGMPISHLEVVNVLCRQFGLAHPKRSIPFELLYAPVRACEIVSGTDPENTTWPWSSLRIAMFGRDNFFSNRKLIGLLPEMRFRSFEDGVRDSLDYYRQFV